MSNHDIEIDQSKLNLMLMRIIGLEKKNLRTKELTDSSMKEELRHIIEEELKCN